MRDRVAVDAYECGLRLTQAIVLSATDSAQFASTAPMLLAVDRFIRALNDMAASCELALDAANRVAEIARDCWNVVNHTRSQSLAYNDAFFDCHQKLLVVLETLSSILRTSALDQRLHDAFEAGKEIAHGEWTDPRLSVTYAPGSAHEEPNWTVNDEDRLAAVLGRLEVTRDCLMPQSQSDVADDFFPELPFFLGGWWAIEAGLRNLRANSHSAVTRSSQLRPEWNRSRGQLTYDGRIIKEVRVSAARNIVTVLDAFQESNWRARIQSPIASDKVNDTVKSLNTNLLTIRFHAETAYGQPGGAISWILRRDE